MKLAVVGGGYVGLVSAVCFAELGHYVDLIEIDGEKVKAINSGMSPIYEKGLEEILCSHIGQNIRATSIYKDISDVDATFICVGTPPRPDGSADLSMIESVSRSIGLALEKRYVFSSP